MKKIPKIPRNKPPSNFDNTKPPSTNSNKPSSPPSNNNKPASPPSKKRGLNAKQIDPSVLAQPASSSLTTDSSIQLAPLERAKALIFSRLSASLISISSMDEEEAEEKTLVPLVLHAAWPGQPIVAMDESEPHCQNLLRETKCAMTVCSFLFPFS
jgi:hypothetical protein